MQNRLVITDLPASIPNLPRSADTLRDLVERHGCWVDRFAFLVGDGGVGVGGRSAAAAAAVAVIELHLENVRDSAVRELNGMIVTLDENGEEIGQEEEESINSETGNDTYDEASDTTNKNISFRIRAGPATPLQAKRLVELCPFEDDPGEMTQTLHLPRGIELSVARSTCGGGTGAEPWRGGILLANLLCSWGNNACIGDTIDDDDDIIDVPSFKTLFHDKVIVELGAGAAGLPSMALAAMADMRKFRDNAGTAPITPSCIIATDGVDEIVCVLRDNVERNGLESAVQVRHLDWNHLPPTMTSKADTIIFSDCVYNEKGADALHNAILHLLRPGGTVLGVLPEWRVGLSNFEAKMKHSGLVPADVSCRSVGKHSLNVSTKDDVSSSSEGVGINSTGGFVCAGGAGKNYRTIIWRYCKE